MFPLFYNYALHCISYIAHYLSLQHFLLDNHRLDIQRLLPKPSLPKTLSSHPCHTKPLCPVRHFTSFIKDVNLSETTPHILPKTTVIALVLHLVLFPNLATLSEFLTVSSLTSEILLPDSSQIKDFLMSHPTSPHCLFLQILSQSLAR